MIYHRMMLRAASEQGTEQMWTDVIYLGQMLGGTGKQFRLLR